MTKQKDPTQVQFRKSTDGTWTTKDFANRHKAITEREVIKHPERKK